MVLTFQSGTALGDVYRVAGAEPWPAGETRTVAPEEGARLTATFPGCFVVVTQPKKPSKPGKA